MATYPSFVQLIGSDGPHRPIGTKRRTISGRSKSFLFGDGLFRTWRFGHILPDADVDTLMAFYDARQATDPPETFDFVSAEDGFTYPGSSFIEEPRAWRDNTLPAGQQRAQVEIASAASPVITDPRVSINTLTQAPGSQFIPAHGISASFAPSGGYTTRRMFEGSNGEYDLIFQPVSQTVANGVLRDWLEGKDTPFVLDYQLDGSQSVVWWDVVPPRPIDDSVFVTLRTAWTLEDATAAFTEGY